MDQTKSPFSFSLSKNISVSALEVDKVCTPTPGSKSTDRNWIAIEIESDSFFYAYLLSVHINDGTVECIISVKLI